MRSKSNRCAYPVRISKSSADFDSAITHGVHSNGRAERSVRAVNFLRRRRAGATRVADMGSMDPVIDVESWRPLAEPCPTDRARAVVRA